MIAPSHRRLEDENLELRMKQEELLDIKSVEAARQVRRRVRELTARFPLPY